jgi:hypothetical protein
MKVKVLMKAAWGGGGGGEGVRTEMKVMVLMKAASIVSFVAPNPEVEVTLRLVTFTAAISLTCMSASAITSCMKVRVLGSVRVRARVSYHVCVVGSNMRVPMQANVSNQLKVGLGFVFATN